MKKIYPYFVLFICLVASAAVKTTLEETAPPTEKQVETAIAILAEAVEASHEGDKDLFKAKLKKAQEFLKYREVKVTYEGQILCGKNVVTEWKDATDCSLYGPQALCYKGEVKEATELLKALVEDDVFNWDEEWLEKPRAQKNAIKVDYVDGPNDLRETISVGSCE